MQPIYLDGDGRARFKENAIVRYLSANRMNDLAEMPFSQEDREHFAQLIGYSVGGFSELSYISNAAYAKASNIEDKLILAKAKKAKVKAQNA